MGAQEKIYYFGYGTNKDLAMMQHMVGRKDLTGEPGVLLDYELAIQNFNQIRGEIKNGSPAPVSPRQIIEEGFDNTFELFVARPKKGAKCHGTIWHLTPHEFELTREWELVDFGMYEDAKGLAVNEAGDEFPIVTQALINKPDDIDRVVEGADYEPYLVPKDKILDKADQVLEDYYNRIKDSGSN